MILLMKKILTDQECEFIANWILTNENYIKSLGPDDYKGTSENSLTGRYNIFNYLNVPEIESILAPRLREVFIDINAEFPLSILCWANTFRKNEGIGLHRHGIDQYYVGNLFIKGPTRPGTTYKKYGDIENEPGVLALLTSHDVHGVKPNASDEVRISMAFDAYSRRNPIPFHRPVKETDQNKPYILYKETK